MGRLDGKCEAAKLNFATIFRLGRDGGTGRRSGLKIRRGLSPRGGSTPPPGTNLTLAVPITSMNFRNARGRRRRSHFCRIGAEIGAVLGSGAFKFLHGSSLVRSAYD